VELRHLFNNNIETATVLVSAQLFENLADQATGIDGLFGQCLTAETRKRKQVIN